MKQPSKKEQVLSFIKARSKVPCPQLGEGIYLRPLSLRELLEIDQRTKDDHNQSLHCIAMGVVDEDGKPVFKNAEEVQELHAGLIMEIGSQVVTISNASEERANEILKNLNSPRP